MTQEEKRLLLIDLCGRLPYGVMIKDTYCGHYGRLVEIGCKFAYFVSKLNSNTLDAQLCHVKPYLRPLSSMTESEMDKLFDILHIDKDDNGEDWIKINDVLGIKFFFSTGRWVENVIEAYDYLNSIHIDYRGLIPMGLALETPVGMYKIK